MVTAPAGLAVVVAGTELGSVVVGTCAAGLGSDVNTAETGATTAGEVSAGLLTATASTEGATTTGACCGGRDARDGERLLALPGSPSTLFATESQSAADIQSATVSSSIAGTSGMPLLGSTVRILAVGLEISSTPGRLPPRRFGSNITVGRSSTPLVSAGVGVVAATAGAAATAIATATSVGAGDAGVGSLAVASEAASGTSMGGATCGCAVSGTNSSIVGEVGSESSMVDSGIDCCSVGSGVAI